ncbi:MAG: hypothetical protein AAFR35_03780 [Pseudomonadota bacterium]
MTAADLSVKERLSRLVTMPDLPPGARTEVARLIKRLDARLRVTLLGSDQGEKSRLVSAFCDDLPVFALPRMATLQITHAPEPLARAMGPDGTWCDLQDPEPAAWPVDAVMVALGRPEELFRRITLLDVVADPSPEDLVAASQWAAPQTDVAIWCSAVFDDSDGAIWDRVPDELTDHARLALTGPDSAARQAQLAEVVQGEFRAVIPVSQDAGGPSALIASVLEDAERAIKARIDRAEAVLARYEPTDKPVAPIRDRADAPASDTTAEVDGEAPQDAAKPSAASAGVKDENLAEHAETLGAVIGLLRETGQSLLWDRRRGGSLTAEAVIESCSAVLGDVSVLVADLDDVADPRLAFLSDAVLEAEGMVVLLELEAGPGPAIEAVTLLLQLRRDFEARLAA